MDDWFLDDRFWENFFGFMFSPAKFAAADEEINQLLKRVDLSGNRVLDVACGPGRHSVALAKKGYSVTGIDRSRFLLEKARKYAIESAVEVEWIEEDMRKFVRSESFDLTISLFTSFGYFQDERENLLVLQNIFKSLKNGGFFVIDLIGKERLARQYQPWTVHEMEDEALLIERPKIADNWSRVRNEWILVRGLTVHRSHFETTVYSGKELQSLLRHAGFSSVTLYGDLNGNEYGIDAARLVAVAQK